MVCAILKNLQVMILKPILRPEKQCNNLKSFGAFAYRNKLVHIPNLDKPGFTLGNSSNANIKQRYLRPAFGNFNRFTSRTSRSSILLKREFHCLGPLLSLTRCEILNIETLPSRSTPQYVPILNQQPIPNHLDSTVGENSQESSGEPSISDYQFQLHDGPTLFNLKWDKLNVPKNLLLVKKPWQPNVRQEMVDFIK